MKRFLLSFCLTIACFIALYAQDQVSLVVSGISNTKEDATAAALRSAIEQTYGAFVSSNTAILNDELIKDEIVTISRGNIQSYKELYCTTLANGKIEVQLQAIVSISKLVSYAKSKGASVELAGATFGMNMKLYELNKKNELEAIRNLEAILEDASPAFAYNVQMEGPIADAHRLDVKGYMVKITAQLIPSDYTESLFSYVYGTLISLSIPLDERKNYKTMGIEFYRFCDDSFNYPNPFKVINKNPFDLDGTSLDLIYLRNDSHTLAHAAPLLFGSTHSQEIHDPSGTRYGYADSFSITPVLKNSLNKLSVADNLSYPEPSPLIVNTYINLRDNSGSQAKVGKDGICKMNKRKPYADGSAYVEFIIDIPKDDISKYSNFQVVEL